MKYVLLFPDKLYGIVSKDIIRKPVSMNKIWRKKNFIVFHKRSFYFVCAYD